MHLDAGGQVIATYNKHQLVPFGEYIPLGELAAQFGIHGMAARDDVGFAAGQGSPIIAVDGLPAYLAMICYEAIFPGLAQTVGVRPKWLLHLTNDAWFGNFSGPYQHLVQTRARAIEQGLPVARAANTGVSAMIDPYGRLVAALPLNTDGFLDVGLPVAAPETLYYRWGEAIWLLFAAVLSIFIAGRQWKLRPKANSRH
jgi:apolipoprotein N-acyltransferase